MPIKESTTGLNFQGIGKEGILSSTVFVSSGEELNKAIIRDIQKKVMSISNKLYRSLVSRSPVREGSFRKNWIMTKNEKSSVPFKRYGSVENPEPAPKPKKMWFRRSTLPNIFITNNTPYCLELETGSSTQAPGGVLSATMAEYRSGTL